MALDIIWTKEARAGLADSIAFLEKRGNETLLQQFSQQLEKKLELIKEYPQLYQKSDRLEGARRCVIDKHHSLLYSYDRVFIYILALWDSRQGS